MYVLWISMIWKPLQSPAEPPMRTACLRRRAGSYRFIVVHCWPLKWKRMKSDIAYYSSIQKQCLQSTFESLNHLEPLFKKKNETCLKLFEYVRDRIISNQSGHNELSLLGRLWYQCCQPSNTFTTVHSCIDYAEHCWAIIRCNKAGWPFMITFLYVPANHA